MFVILKNDDANFVIIGEKSSLFIYRLIMNGRLAITKTIRELNLFDKFRNVFIYLYIFKILFWIMTILVFIQSIEPPSDD